MLHSPYSMADTEHIKRIREATGLSFSDISDALKRAHGDEAKALELLKKRGIAIAEKKSRRQVREGIVESYIHSTRKVGALVELLCETDFVARNDEFRGLAHDVAMHVAAMKPVDSVGLLEQSFVKDESMTVQELINRHVAKLGENIRVGKFTVFEL